MAREEVNLLLAEQRKTAALKVRERDAALSHGSQATPGERLLIPGTAASYEVTAACVSGSETLSVG